MLYNVSKLRTAFRDVESVVISLTAVKSCVISEQQSLNKQPAPVCYTVRHFYSHAPLPPTNTSSTHITQLPPLYDILPNWTPYVISTVKPT
jgi:hypothetical protein